MNLVDSTIRFAMPMLGVTVRWLREELRAKEVSGISTEPCLRELAADAEAAAELSFATASRARRAGALSTGCVPSLPTARSSFARGRSRTMPSRQAPASPRLSSGSRGNSRCRARGEFRTRWPRRASTRRPPTCIGRAPTTPAYPLTSRPRRTRGGAGGFGRLRNGRGTFAAGGHVHFAPMQQQPPESLSMIREFHFADWFTLGNAVCGRRRAVLGDDATCETGDVQRLYYACALILAALIFDVLDGRIARWRQKSLRDGARARFAGGRDLLRRGAAR